MRQVPIAEFKDNASAWIAAAEAGEEIVVTRHGKPAAKLTAPDGGMAQLAAAEVERKARQAVAIEGLFAAGREYRAKYGGVSHDEVIAWIKEDQRWNGVVVDASLIGLILLEEDSRAVAETLETHLLGAELLLAAHWPLEVASLLVKATRRRRLSPYEREPRLILLERMAASGRLQPAAATRVVVDLALATGLTAYDAAYLELAVRLDATLATNDDALIAVARGRGVPVLTTRP